MCVFVQGRGCNCLIRVHGIQPNPGMCIDQDWDVAKTFPGRTSCRWGANSVRDSGLCESAVRAPCSPCSPCIPSIRPATQGLNTLKIKQQPGMNPFLVPGFWVQNTVPYAGTMAFHRDLPSITSENPRKKGTALHITHYTKRTLCI